MPVGRVETLWAVPGGGAGMSVMHVYVASGVPTSAEGTSIMAAVRAFWGTFAARLPNDVTLSFPGPIDVFTDAGVLSGSTVPGTAPASVTGGYSGTWANATGARLVHETGTISGGKRIRGSTYIVPIAGDQYDSDGTLATDFVNAVLAAATTMRTALSTATFPLTVWSRKQAANFVVSGNTMADKTAILRARRDA